MAYCPNISDSNVIKEFNSIVEHFNGKPLSLDEFKDVQLRDARVGVDKTSMNLAYELWNKYAGNIEQIKNDGIYTKSRLDAKISNMPKANIPQNLISGIEAFGTKQEANSEAKKLLGDSPHSIDMIEAGIRTRTTRSVGEMQKYNIKVGDIVKQFGKSSDGTVKNILTRITAIHPKGTPGFLNTWEKEGWTQEGIKFIERYKDGAAAIEFEIINNSQVNNQQEKTNYTSFNIKPEVQELFGQNSELSKIGTPQQYSQYLNTIFPESKVKDIVYHHSSKKLESFDKQYLGKETSAPDTNLGFFFAEDKKDIPNMVAEKNKQLEQINASFRLNFSVENRVLLNLKTPKYYYGFIDSAASDEIGKYAETAEDYKNVRLSLEKKGHDSLVYGLYIEPDGEGGTDVNHGYVVFEPEQIHILSSKKDLEMFRNFINFTKSEYAKYGDIQQFRDYIMSKNFAAIEEFLVVNNKIDRKC